MKQTDNLSRTLQNPDLSAAEDQEIAADVVLTLQKDRSEDSFKLFWELLEQRRQELSISPPKLPRKRKMPDFFGSRDDPSTQHFHDTPKDRYRRFYFEAFDFTIQSIKARFNQQDFKQYSVLQQLILKAANGEDYKVEFENITKFYKEDFKAPLLSTQLAGLTNSLRSVGKLNISEVIKLFQNMSAARKSLLSEVIKVVKLLLVMPATNAISERSFSALKRVKAYLRSTMKDNRLNHLMILHVHKPRTDALDMVSIVNIFVSDSFERKEKFGKFKEGDLQRKSSTKDASTQTAM